MPDLDTDILRGLGKKQQPLLLKEKIVRKNLNHHPELASAWYSKQVLWRALYRPTLVINSQPKARPDFWVFIHTNGTNDLAVVELGLNKGRYEVVGWYQIDTRRFENIKRRARREGGQFLITNFGKAEKGAVDRISACPSGSKKNIHKSGRKGKSKLLKHIEEALI